MWKRPHAASMPPGRCLRQPRSKPRPFRLRTFSLRNVRPGWRRLTFFQVRPPPIPLAYRLNPRAITGARCSAHRSCASPIRCQRTRLLPNPSRLTAVASFHGTCTRGRSGHSLRCPPTATTVQAAHFRLANASQPFRRLTCPAPPVSTARVPSAFPGAPLGACHRSRGSRPPTLYLGPTPRLEHFNHPADIPGTGEPLPAAQALPALVMPVILMVTWLAGVTPRSRTWLYVRLSGRHSFLPQAEPGGEISGGRRKKLLPYP